MNATLKKFGSWLLSEPGKQFVMGTAAFGSVGVGCCYYIPHTFLLDKYKDFMHFYRHGFQLPVPGILVERFNKTLDLLEIPEYDRKQYKPFMVIGFDIFSAGSYFSRYGVIIGLPTNFTYLDEDHVDTSQIQVVGNSVPWETPEGKLLFKSLLVSEKAQLYAIAREIEIRQSAKFLLDSFNPVVMSFLSYAFGHHFNTKFNLLSKSRFVRFTMYGLVGSFFFTNYLFVKDFIQVYSEKKVDEYLVKKNPLFREGGKEYYERILQRNVALRKLMGKLGEHNYTLHGNENYLIRQRHLPIVQRKSFFDMDVEQV